MLPTHQGSLRLFRFAGVNVFVHWSWLVVAVITIRWRADIYSSYLWNVLEYVALFGIVTLHEFGHALACRSVGGQANQIVLWPLGGVAYVRPPHRPGAHLWSIAAGPLVNVILVPVFFVLAYAVANAGSDLRMFVRAVAFTNVILLLFNLLPVYPLDGGQILRSVLWFFVGPARSLMAVAVIGMVGVVGLVFLAFNAGSIWLGILAAFAGLRCWSALQLARELGKLEKLPRHLGWQCPSCRVAPPIGAFWSCPQCDAAFDAFQANNSCPQCGAAFDTPRCVDCGEASPVAFWGARRPPVIVPPR